jgi:uncharacterized membrane protein YdjX (TVP38/TMEM64 family)
MKKKVRIGLDIALVALIAGWIIFLVIYTPSRLIESLGVHNTYLLVFLFTLLGGIATLTFISVYPHIIALSAAGLNPFVTGIVASAGFTIANLLFYYFGKRGGDIARTSPKFKKTTESMLKWIGRKPCWCVYAFIFFYVGFTPFPNNLLTAYGGAINFSAKRIAAPLFLGNIVFLTTISYIGSVGYNIIG